MDYDDEEEWDDDIYDPAQSSSAYYGGMNDDHENYSYQVGKSRNDGDNTIANFGAKRAPVFTPGTSFFQYEKM